jgi:hypothetical protein
MKFGQLTFTSNSEFSGSPIALLIVAFFLALTVRLSIVAETPGSNRSIDLCIYTSGGQLFTHGINPYNSIFPICTPATNLRTFIVIYVYAGLNAMKTLWRATPYG